MNGVLEGDKARIGLGCGQTDGEAEGAEGQANVTRWESRAGASMAYGEGGKQE